MKYIVIVIAIIFFATNLNAQTLVEVTSITTGIERQITTNPITVKVENLGFEVVDFQERGVQEEATTLTDSEQKQVLTKLLKGAYWNPQLVEEGLKKGELKLTIAREKENNGNGNTKRRN